MSGIADTIGRAAQAVEEFRGDHEELAAVMRASWVDSPGAPYLYTADLLADWLRYPGTEQAPTPAIYADDGLVAFAAGLPRQAEVAGATRRILISTFLTVAAEQKAAGYGIVVWSELMRRAAAAGYDGVVNYCADGEPMHRMIETGCRLLDLPLIRVKSFSYLVGRVAPDPGAPARSGERPSASQLVDAAATDAERGGGDPAARLWRVWSVAEAEWQLSRIGSVAVGDGDAVLTGSVVTVADAARSRYLVVDDVLWGSAGDEARARLLGDLLAQAAADGASYAVLPVMGYADVRPFLAVGMVPSPHTMHAYLTLWSDPDAVRPVERYYLDVI
ncbi:MAG: hypothetical protein ACXVRP_06630 [Solirubrobacteraceae bacterium]